MRSGVASPVIDAASRLLVPFMWLFATYVLVHGHDSPGGGFQGGVILAASIILLRLVRGRDRLLAFTSNHALTLACAGPLLYGGIGIACLLFGGNFLDYGALPLPLDPADPSCTDVEPRVVVAAQQLAASLAAPFPIVVTRSIGAGKFGGHRRASGVIPWSFHDDMRAHVAHSGASQARNL